MGDALERRLCGGDREDAASGAVVRGWKSGGRVDVLAAAAAQDDSLPFAFGPPVEIVSPHELAGEYLLRLERPDDAVREYKLALARAPGRTTSLIGLAYAQLKLGARDGGASRVPARGEELRACGSCGSSGNRPASIAIERSATVRHGSLSAFEHFRFNRESLRKFSAENVRNTDIS